MRARASTCRSRSCRPPPPAAWASVWCVAQLASEFAQCTTSMADRMLLLGRQLCERSPVAAVGHEDRVVPEAAIAVRFACDRAVDPTVGHDLVAVREAGDDDGPEARGSIARGHAVEGAQQLDHVVDVCRVL